jgi:hypothetical protein
MVEMFVKIRAQASNIPLCFLFYGPIQVVCVRLQVVFWVPSTVGVALPEAAVALPAVAVAASAVSPRVQLVVTVGRSPAPLVLETLSRALPPAPQLFVLRPRLSLSPSPSRATVTLARRPSSARR